MQEGSFPHPQEDGAGLWGGIFLSFLLHVAVVWALFFFPPVTVRKAPSHPVYTVDLVGGEKIGAETLTSTITPSPKPQKATQKVKTEPPAKKKAEDKGQKKRQVESPTPIPQKAPSKAVQAETKKEEPREAGLSGQVREKLIQAAVERVKERAEPKKEEESSSGLGEGKGAAAPGAGGRGGGVVRGVEFLIYRNRMLSLIRERWTWVGKRSNLEVTVRFGIRENGEIIGLRVVRNSEDPAYDDSVIRAVRKTSPLPPPPENYRKDFLDVELTFRPKDLGA